MRIRGYYRVRDLIERERARRFVASFDQTAYPAPDEVRERLRGKLEAILDENIVPFWFPDCIDEKHGGYLAECNLSGEWETGRNKNLVSQSRILWFASKLINFGRTSDENIQWAQHGFQFLKDRLLDKKHGGFFWEVDGRNGEPTMPDKHLYGQAFALYALSEFALATGDTNARTMARQLFEVLDEHAHDSVHGGFHEFFRSDWQPADSSKPSYMGHPPDVKQLNTHLHLMEAFTRYASLDDSELIRERLTELIQIQSGTVVNEEEHCCTDVYSTDWQRYDGDRYNQVQYGHDLENVWLLIEANRTVGAANTPFLELYETLFLNAVRYGWDVSKSGFYFRGRPLKRAHIRGKTWWVQAEALLSALHMYYLTGQAMYFQIFEQMLAWIDRRQVDWSGGEWYTRIEASGAPSGSKASDANNRWKTPYHNGRAVIHCLELLTKLTPSSDSRVQ